ncbi:protein-tyrosine sulfotransferase 1-like [Saccoglossus kowalevskii]|uniref:Protein-tyrosine sulfotransferase n=1 Tax=Saccoglossus kowalevskii TaxID=10224 RepID=A0A1B1JCH3_SACKO|nr:PREDICTED: protein-tyrosine sulfotransferase-like [Saccoglossus kowalevskii]ANS11606.1 protein-tyrosine sulfotransferase-like protein [Saccoglossus kowalevskii]
MGKRLRHGVKILAILIFGILVINLLLLMGFEDGDIPNNFEYYQKMASDSRKHARAVFKEILQDQSKVISDNWEVLNFTKFSDNDRNRPIVFIGGVPRSGTTLMRAMLDAHPDIRIGEETRIIPMIIQMHRHILSSEKEVSRLQEAGVSETIMEAALGAYIMEITVRHGEKASLIGNKDPLVLLSMVQLAKIFPNASFLFMVRDGRAVVHSIITRRVTVTGFDLNSFRSALQTWNRYIEHMHKQCLELGLGRCLPVYYEQLVLHPKIWMKKILKFLKVPWDDSVLKHHETVGKPGGISLSRLEFSTDQVVRPINVAALSSWVGHVPEEVLKNMPQFAPMLANLGYDPMAIPPNYGIPDELVRNNTQYLKASNIFPDNSIPKDTIERVRKNEEALRLAKEYQKSRI